MATCTDVHWMAINRCSKWMATLTNSYKNAWHMYRCPLLVYKQMFQMDGYIDR